MFRNHCVRAPAKRKAALRRLLLGASLLALMGSCATTPPPPPVTAADPSDPSARVAAVRNPSTLGSYTSRRPVEATISDEQNEHPPPKQ